jgi:CBS domain-containing protein
VLNANYLLRKLQPYYDTPYKQHCKHEFVLSGKRQKKQGVRTMDIAKRILDFGYHPPTIYFPIIVEECLMVEPTETESKETLDEFAEVMIQIAKEAEEFRIRLQHHAGVVRLQACLIGLHGPVEGKEVRILAEGLGEDAVAVGIALLLVSGTLAGIWLALIGWFVLLAAEGERRQASDRSALDGVRVRDVMIEDPPLVGPNTPLRELAYDVLCDPQHSSFPVMDGNRPVGLISLNAGSTLVRSAGGRVADHMIALDRAPTLSPDQAASDALVELAQSELCSALVCKGGRLVGLVSISDLGRVLELRTAEGKAARAALDADEIGPAASRE